ncbi:MAG: hypothetical protein WAM14_04150 [Candidatus Nitrosopolaris sp.]
MKFNKSNKTILIRGRMDARLGNLIIEFETNIISERKISEATSLEDLMEQLRNNATFVLLLTIPIF